MLVKGLKARHFPETLSLKSSGARYLVAAAAASKATHPSALRVAEMIEVHYAHQNELR
jgi:hypothetical protein